MPTIPPNIPAMYPTGQQTPNGDNLYRVQVTAFEAGLIYGLLVTATKQANSEKHFLETLSRRFVLPTGEHEWRDAKPKP